MKIRLGYVAISLSLGNVTSSSLMTYTHYKKLGFNRGQDKLDKIILSNFRDLKYILTYNVKNQVSFYRMTSRLIPLATHSDVPIDLDKYKSNFMEIGSFIKDHNIRMDTHPDQFCVLNSIKLDVVASSIIMLKHHQNMFNLMNYDGRMIIHVGSGTDGKRNSLKRFEDNFITLDESLKRMILLENDDKIFNVNDTLKLCEKLKIPMVLDYHHHLCCHTNTKIEKYMSRIVGTWGNLTPKMHFSSSKSKKDKRSHHDYIDVDEFIEFIEKIKFIDRDIDIMIEAKMKDEALFRLVRLLKYKTNYEFVNETTFIIK